MSPTSDDSLADLIKAGEIQAAARRRAAGLADAERKKRRQLALELVNELRRPLCESSPPTDLAHLAALAPSARPWR